MAAILELLGRQRQRRVGTADDVLAAAARDHAAGKSPDLAAVDVALHELHKPIEHFAELCRLAAIRREAGAAFEKLGTATTKHRRLVEALDHERTKHDELRDAFLRRAGAIESEIASVEAVITKAKQARETLLVPANVIGSARPRYEEALADRQAAIVEVEKLQREIRETRNRIKEADRWIESIAHSIDRELSPAGMLSKTVQVPASIARQMEPHELAKKRGQGRLGELEPALRDAEERLDRAERSVAAVELEILRQD